MLALLQILPPDDDYDDEDDDDELIENMMKMMNRYIEKYACTSSKIAT